MGCPNFPACDCVAFCKNKQRMQPAPTAPSVRGDRSRKNRPLWSPRDLDGHECEYCGVTMQLGHPLFGPTRDHVVPRSKGGSNAKSNSARACRMCNEQKGSFLLGEFYEWLVENGDPRAERVGRFIAKLPKEMV